MADWLALVGCSHFRCTCSDIEYVCGDYVGLSEETAMTDLTERVIDLERKLAAFQCRFDCLVGQIADYAEQIRCQSYRQNDQWEKGENWQRQETARYLKKMIARVRPRGQSND